MAEKESLEYLENELAKQIGGFDESRQYFRTQYFYFTLSTAALSAATTVLIGASQRWPEPWLSIPALISSAAITVLAAWDGFLRSRELWIQKGDTWMALQNLRAQISYAKTKTSSLLTQQQIDDFYKRFDQIIMGEHELWKTVRSTQASTQVPVRRPARRRDRADAPARGAPDTEA